MEGANTKRGLVGLLVIIVVIVAILSYFSVDLRAVFENETFRENVRFLWALLTTVWEKFLAAPAAFMWEKILGPYVWSPLLELLKNEPSGPPDGNGMILLTKFYG